jgi:hypothetical protein
MHVRGWRGGCQHLRIPESGQARRLAAPRRSGPLALPYQHEDGSAESGIVQGLQEDAGLQGVDKLNGSTTVITPPGRVLPGRPCLAKLRESRV